MKVINFNPIQFEEYLHTIVDDIIDDKNSILVLGVREGGIPIAQMVYNQLKMVNHLKVDLDDVLCQRPTTKVKKKNQQREELVKTIFRWTPEVLLNQLRIAEHHLITSKKVNPTREVSFRQPIDFSWYDLILIVDDAVDTGYSMTEIINHIRVVSKSHPHIKTLSAVVTKGNPVITPDYFLYRDVLIRFPWSLDAK